MKAIFLRALEETEDKNRAMREAIESPGSALGRTRFDVETDVFRRVPRSPFAYWARPSALKTFGACPPLEHGGRRTAAGASTRDNTRFLRATWEVDPSTHCSLPSLKADGPSWVPLAKGGAFGKFYSDVHLLVLWSGEGHQLKVATSDWRESKGWGSHWRAELHNADEYGRAGLTWPRRTKSNLSVRAMPAGCIFGDKGPAVLVQDDEPVSLLAHLAMMNSTAFMSLVELQLAAADARAGGAARSYEVGVIKRTPVPTTTKEQSQDLAELATSQWTIRRNLDSVVECSHAFLLPGILQVKADSIGERIGLWRQHWLESVAKYSRGQARLDDLCFELYGIRGVDREQIENGLGEESASAESDEAEVAEDEDVSVAACEAVPLVSLIVSWTVGVALGRFDLRLASSDSPAPLAPGPFEPLSACSPGMLTGEDGLPLDAPPAEYSIDFPRDGILVDDAGADSDLVAASRQVFELIFDDPPARWQEATDILGERSLRLWLANEFFEFHKRQFSKSRRKAPIYWQLATPSASYSAWLYYHRFTHDTLFRLLNDHIAPKLQHEERKLTNLTQDAGSSPTASQRKEIDAQETFVGELRAFRDEVERVAPLWNPNLNDGVILNFAPLWRLVPQHKAWQKECKSAWDKLCKGDYDWAHLAMHLWPERVVPKCAKDRSFAIAHSLEEVFWLEDQDGKWQPKTVSDEEVESLVAERTSPAVKAALKSILEAPAPAAGRGRTPRRKKATTRRAKAAAPSDASVASPEQTPRRSTSTRIPDASILDQIRSAIATLGGNAAKSDILDSTGLSASQWTPAINALLADGSVKKTGQKRGTRYHLAQDPS